MNLTRKFDIEDFRAVREAAVCSRYLAGADGERNGGAGHGRSPVSFGEAWYQDREQETAATQTGEVLGIPRIS